MQKRAERGAVRALKVCCFGRLSALGSLPANFLRLDVTSAFFALWAGRGAQSQAAHTGKQEEPLLTKQRISGIGRRTAGVELEGIRCRRLAHSQADGRGGDRSSTLPSAADRFSSWLVSGAA